jgi:integrase
MAKPNRSELAVLRGKTGSQSLAQWTEAFAGGDQETARLYLSVLGRFTGRPEGRGAEHDAYMGAYSPTTRRVYSHALVEFFEWIASKYGRVVAPPQVTRKDAEDYVGWLTTRPYSLEGERLRDGDQRDRLALYEIVRELGSADIDSIRARAPAWLVAAHPARDDAAKLDKEWLNRELGRMVLHDLLVRSPTIEELRKEDFRIGISIFTVTIPDGNTTHEVDLSDVFSYSLPAPRAVSRSTVSLRLAALASFWAALMSGENARGGPALITYNIFQDLAHRVRRGLAADNRAAASRRGRLTPQLIERLLKAADGPSLTDKRDAAILWFLVLTGARVTEMTRLRRDRPSSAEANRWPGWYDARANPPTVEFVRKGGFRQRLPYPPYALQALHAFQTELSKRAALVGMQSTDAHGAHYLPPTSPAWRYKALAEQPDAPLFPPVSFWGNNSSQNYQEFKPNADVRPEYRRSMSRHGVDAALKRVAKKAGFTEEEVALVHGHAFRHFAATAMSRQGKALREIQHILGHDSVTTTERYVEPETTPEALSGQNEILDYISKGASYEPPTPPVPVPARQPPIPKAQPSPPSRIIETHGVPARPVREKPTKREWPATRPEVQQPETLPAQSPRVDPEAVIPIENRLVALAPDGPMPPPGSEVRENISPPSPWWGYAGRGPLKPGQPPEDRAAQQEKLEFSRSDRRTRRTQSAATLYKKKGVDMVQANPWLAKHYDPWPINYGLGESSVLPWFARGSADVNGEVTVEVRSKTGQKKVVVVPPIPVLSLHQTDPALMQTHAKLLWQQVDAMRTRWLRTSPSRAFGLDRWWGVFLTMQIGLLNGTQRKFRWVPFGAPAKLGEEIHEHDEQYLVEWLEINADRYTATVRAFEDIARLRGSSETERAEWLEFQRTWRDASVIGVSPAEELPDWFIVSDPVHDIYDQSPEEWEWFAKWIGAVTGQKLTPVREASLKDEMVVTDNERSVRIEQARTLLQGYYDTVSTLRGTSGEARSAERTTLKFLTDQLAEFGVPDPAQMLKEGKLKKRQRREANIEQLLAMAFPAVEVAEVDPNVLKSKLFDADTLRLDLTNRTISHTDEFRKLFAERYDGRDSECVVRRAARGMWEHVKRHGIPIQRGAERSSEYSLLYSVMLSYMAWIFPCPEEIERRMAEEGLESKEGLLVWLNGVRRTGHRMVTTTQDQDENALRVLAAEEGLDRKSADEVMEAVLVVDSLRAEVALPAPEITEAVARSVVKSGNVSVSGGTVVVRRRPSPRQLRAEEQAPEPPETEQEQPPASEPVPSAEEPTVLRSGRPTVVRRRAGERPKRPAPEPVRQEEEAEEMEWLQQAGPEWLATVGGTMSEEREAGFEGAGLQEERMGSEPDVEQTEEQFAEGLTENRRGARYMTLGAYMAGSGYVANAERVLPSAIRMMAAMTLPF